MLQTCCRTLQLANLRARPRVGCLHLGTNLMTRKRQAASAPLAASKRDSRKKGACIVKVPADPGTTADRCSSQSDIVVTSYGVGLVAGTLLRRYKRFLGDVQLAGLPAPLLDPLEQQQVEGTTTGVTVVHVPNTGPMTGLLDRLPSPALLSCAAPGSKRKYAHTLEWVQPEPEGTWVGVHSAKANAMVAQLLSRRLIPGLPPYTGIQAEVKYGSDGKSRVDFVLHGSRGSTTHVEVKSVTLAEDLLEGSGGIALFPDTVSKRAQRHVKELTLLATASSSSLPTGGAGEHSRGSDVCESDKCSHSGAALVFVVQRGDCTAFAPCYEKDPVYSRLVAEAAAAGVAVVAVACWLDAAAGVVRYGGQLPVRLDYKQCAE